MYVHTWIRVGENGPHLPMFEKEGWKLGSGRGRGKTREGSCRLWLGFDARMDDDEMALSAKRKRKICRKRRRV